MSYTEKLKDPRWQKKRLEILNRDSFSCQICGDTESTLHVHHRWYNNKEPWKCDNNCLITLCSNCHESESENIQSASSDLVLILKQCGFFSHDIENIANGFINCEYSHVIFSDMIKYLLSNTDEILALESRYFNAIGNNK